MAIPVVARRLAAIGLLLVPALFGQVQPGVAARSELKYFRNLLMGVANLEDSRADLDRREKTVVAQFRLNEAQAKALRAVADEFRRGLVEIRNSANSVKSARPGGLTDADRARLRDLATARDEMVLRLVDRLFREVGPEAAQRMRAPVSW